MKISNFQSENEFLFWRYFNFFVICLVDELELEKSAVGNTKEVLFVNIRCVVIEEIEIFLVILKSESD